ncbi:hypothetical protein LY90DRAFT_698569 [Neocallimastix californiae]|uniref:Dynein regulatory complex protein 10 n=1 Tax=Neocallimastix californiae TaxID=1754190 RepID=A0A1Y2F229_9FUNG|nr:hypothetical protein LY90DRAFT_698569 [Neocallimastix californiae]|eukprot:ORY77544.1 hypothetical protein LY90DRAFT_698569 [Neocallimastix californiae]
MNSILKNGISTENNLTPVPVPSSNQPNSNKKKNLEQVRKFSVTDLMVSENDRSPCYVQRQRIKSVLNELYKKVIIIGLIPETFLRHYSNIFDPEVSAAIKEYIEVKNEYLSVRKLKGLGDVNSIYLNEVIKKYKSAVRNIYRAFLFSPEAYLQLMKYQNDSNNNKPIEIKKFEKTVAEILNFLYDKLDTTFEQDQKKQKEIKDITDIEIKKKEEVENFKTILRNAINDRYENISEKQKKWNNIKQIIEREKKVSSDKKRQLNAEINILTEKLNEKMNINKEEENTHLKKKFRIESEIENWIHRYDDEVSKKQEEYESVTKKYNEQHTALLELKERYEKLKEEYKKEKEERELKRQAEEIRTFKIVQTRHCALVIVRFYKAYLKRKQAKMNNSKKRR